MDSMPPCYSLLNVKVIWLYIVSATPPITIGGEGSAGGGGGWLKSLLCYKTIISQNVPSEAQVKNFFVW